MCRLISRGVQGAIKAAVKQEFEETMISNEQQLVGSLLAGMV